MVMLPNTLQHPKQRRKIVGLGEKMEFSYQAQKLSYRRARKELIFQNLEVKSKENQENTGELSEQRT
uniref:Uncharacterized protein n=1 Tax=Rhizophora mucronata TaxID=61149 RepID=A0A2P2K867_RHIMU